MFLSLLEQWSWWCGGLPLPFFWKQQATLLLGCGVGADFGCYKFPYHSHHWLSLCWKTTSISIFLFAEAVLFFTWTRVRHLLWLYFDAATAAHLPTWVQLSHHHLCPFHFVHSHLSSLSKYAANFQFCEGFWRD